MSNLILKQRLFFALSLKIVKVVYLPATQSWPSWMIFFFYLFLNESDTLKLYVESFELIIVRIHKDLYSFILKETAFLGWVIETVTQ